MKISVIIPAYNHEMYIGAAIKSILKQSFEDFELIIINDGSTDNTEKEILKFDDSRITYIYQKNQGAHNTLNKGIDLANGDYISILNSDDIYNHNRLERCIKFLENRKECSIVITEVEGINSVDISVAKSKLPHTEAWLRWYDEALHFYENREFLICAFAHNILITTSNLFMRKQVFEEVGKFRKLRYAHDWDMLLRFSQSCNVHLMRDVLLKYRIHESNTVHEENSEAKVKFEVNWLIADNIKHLRQDMDYFKLMNSLKINPYLNFELFSLLLMINDFSQSEMLLDFDNVTTLKMMELLN